MQKSHKVNQQFFFYLEVKDAVVSGLWTAVS